MSDAIFPIVAANLSYVDIHTLQFPNGAIKGQLKPLPPSSCVAGFFSRGGNSLAPCDPCPPGYAQSRDGANTCDICPVGMYQDVAGSSSCSICPAGTRSRASGSFLASQCVGRSDVFAWGSNSQGQLGLGDSLARSAPSAALAHAGQTVVSISAAATHSLVVYCTPPPRFCDTSADGSLFSAGSSVAGALGLSGVSVALTPRRVNVTGIARCATSATHSLCVTSMTLPLQTHAAASGAVVAFGDNTFGQLGLTATSAEASPRVVDAFAGIRIVGVACGEGFSMFLAGVPPLLMILIRVRPRHRVRCWPK